MGLIQVGRIAVNLMGKAVLLAAKWAGRRRKRALEAMAARPNSDKDKEIVFLRDRVAELQSRVEILRQLHKPDNTNRYTIRERFIVIFHLTYFAIPRRRVKEYLGIGRSTLYRWLKNIGGERQRHGRHGIVQLPRSLLWFGLSSIPTRIGGGFA